MLPGGRPPQEPSQETQGDGKPPDEPASTALVAKSKGLEAGLGLILQSWGLT